MFDKYRCLTLLRCIVIGSLLLLCNACGWHLQGAQRISAALLPMYVQLSDLHSDFSVALQSRLQTSGVRLTQDSMQAQATLHIIKDDTGRRVISVSESNTPLEYEVFYNIQIEVRSKSGDILLEQPLSAARSVTYNEAAALAKEREQRLITVTLAGELADQLVRQIRTL